MHNLRIVWCTEVTNFSCLCTTGVQTVNFREKMQDISLLILSFATIIVKAAENPKSWAFSSCTENTSWNIDTSGAAIKSWINSFVPTLEKVSKLLEFQTQIDFFYTL